MQISDAAAVLAIYAEGIVTGHATFEAEAGDWPNWDQGHLVACRLVAEDDGPGDDPGDDKLLGWAALSAVSDRCAYGGVAEISVYVAEAARGRRVGRRLLQALVAASEAAGIWTLQAGIFPENRASIVLHEQCGFRIIGTRERLGQMTYGPMAGQWRDVVLLERRSDSVGVDQPSD